MKKVRYGVIGLGNMGSVHAKNLSEGKIRDAALAAVCDIVPEKMNEYRQTEVACFEDGKEMIASGLIDCVVIATPHYSHCDFAGYALENGVNVIVEKPAGVYTKQVKEMNRAAENKGLVFSIMFNMRTDAVFKKMRELVMDGTIGEIKRTNWIMTAWYRPQSYYDSGTWRATWAGEGGGVLFNQCPHNLDLFLWITGMRPKTVTSRCYFGKWHDIEVEDDVTAFFEYENGATGVIVSSTGDTPGTNRFEILGDKGKLVFDGEGVTLYKLAQSERQFNAEFRGGFGEPECEKIRFDLKVDYSVQHNAVLQNVTDAILGKAPLYIDGKEGLQECMLADAILLSSWLGETVTLPFDDDLYFAELQKRVATSRKKNTGDTVLSIDNSFQK